MKIDLDVERLHTAVDAINNKKHLPRRAGKTTAYVVLMLAEVALGDCGNTYLYVGPTPRCAIDAMVMFYDMMYDQYGSTVIKLTSTSAQRIVTTFDQQFIFTSEGELSSSCVLKGRTLHRVFYDVAPVHRMAYRTIRPHLDAKSGDII